MAIFAMASRPNQPGVDLDLVAPLAGSSSALEVALSAAADALGALPPAEFDRLCEQEVIDLQATLTFFELTGPPGKRFPPATVLGNRIIALFAARYPLLATDGDGTA
jgi:hypothetical protein